MKSVTTSTPGSSEVSSFSFSFSCVLIEKIFTEFVWDLTCTVTLWSLIILKTLCFSTLPVASLTWGHFHSIIKLIMAGNCPSLPRHLSASHLLNGIKINQWLLVCASLLLLLLLQSEKMASGGGGGGGGGLRSGLGPPPGAAVMTPYNPNGLLHAALT